VQIKSTSVFIGGTDNIVAVVAYIIDNRAQANTNSEILATLLTGSGDPAASGLSEIGFVQIGSSSKRSR
jgi:hypothetical protein